MNNSAVSKKGTVYGVGINDSDYVVQPSINGKQVICPIYRKWKDMIKRCYSAQFQEKYPTYIGCTVINDWLLFSNFRKWMLAQEHKGLELDKDIKNKGNKIYSPETCLFIPTALNRLLNDSAAARGEWPVGVCWHKRDRRFIAKLSFNGKRGYLGIFSTVEQASNVYQRARTEKILQLIRGDIYPMATAYLAQHV